MIDKHGKKYLVIRFVENYDMEEQKESDWSLVEDNEEFAYTNWFSYNDYWKFADIADIREEIYIIENWLRLDLAKKWCKKHNIEYKIEVPVEYPQELAEREIRKSIRGKIRDTKFKEPFGFLNH